MVEDVLCTSVACDTIYAFFFDAPDFHRGKTLPRLPEIPAKQPNRLSRR